MDQSIHPSWCMLTILWAQPSLDTAQKYLMFGHWPHLLINFYFPTEQGTLKHQQVDHYVTELHEWLQEAFKEAQTQPTSEAERQKQHYYRKANAVSLKPGDLVLAKANA